MDTRSKRGFAVPFVRVPGNYSPDDVSQETGLCCDDESLTVQEDKDDADINVLVKRFGVTGELPTNVRAPVLYDFEGVVDFKTAMDAVIEARDSFNEMPAEVRARFDNDPHKFVNFCSEPKNREEAESLGLIVPAALEPEPIKVKVIPDAPAKPA